MTDSSKPRPLFDFSPYVSDPSRVVRDMSHAKMKFDAREDEVVAGIELIKELRADTEKYGGKFRPSDLSLNHYRAVAHFHGKTAAVINPDALNAAVTVVKSHIEKGLSSQYFNPDELIQFLNSVQDDTFYVDKDGDSRELKSVKRTPKRPLPSA